MAARAIQFVSKRLQRATFAFLCLALTQLAMGVASLQTQPQASVRVHIAQP